LIGFDEGDHKDFWISGLEFKIEDGIASLNYLLILAWIDFLVISDFRIGILLL
jgi:hypothetical protein